MALLIIESFATVAVDSSSLLAYLQGKGWVNVGGAVSLDDAGSGPIAARFAGGRYMNTTAGRGVYTEFAATATLIMGAAVAPDDWPMTLMSMRDGATIQTELRLDSSGHLIVMRNGTQIGSTGTTVLSKDTWRYVEFKCVINDTTGSFEVRVDGVVEITGSALDTKNTANASVTRAYFVPATESCSYSDLYVDTSTFNGPIRVAALLPNGNGNSSQLVGSDGNSTDNYLLVDDLPTDIFANGDVDYVESATVTNKDTYAFANLPSAAASVVAVQSSLVARADDAGAKGIRHVTRSGGSDFEGTTRNLSSTYAYYTELRAVDPATGVAWTESGVNAMEMGMKVQS